MQLLPIFAISVTAAILGLALKKRNAEISVLLTLAAAALILISTFSAAGEVIGNINSIVAATDINTDYIKILLKVTGLCLLTQFGSDICREAGSPSLASNVTLAGRLLVTVTALPLYSDILSTVTTLLKG